MDPRSQKAQMAAEDADEINSVRSQIEDRRAAMSLYAQAQPGELQVVLEALGGGEYATIREPETGLVMIRGRIGGDGTPFNLGEATVTRATVRLPSGEIGYSYILGRDQEKARLAALCDALWQSIANRPFIETRVLAPIRARLAAEQKETRARTAATRVDFFTMVRGEDTP
jgi:alpha-D-ribose 1-methylphosphonate 5-triphosphate synthase subunit PhnG